MIQLSCAPLSDRERAKPEAHLARRRRQKAKAKRNSLSSVDSTFPDRLKPLAEKFYQQALSHPAFVFMTAGEIRQSIENRIWSLASNWPMWFGSGPVVKREATEAQLAALDKARQARIELDRENEAYAQQLADARAKATATA